MWMLCFFGSIGVLVLAAVLSFLAGKSKFAQAHHFTFFKILFAGVFISALFLYFPAYLLGAGADFWGIWQAFLLSMLDAMQVLGGGGEFDTIQGGIGACPETLITFYQVWAATLFVLGPICTVGFVLSMIKNLSARIQYFCAYFKDVYIFSELNDRSLALAADIRGKEKKAAIVFTNVSVSSGENADALAEEAKRMGAICFPKDILTANFKRHDPNKDIRFFAMGTDEAGNLDQALALIEKFRERRNTHLYVFSNQIESELLLTAVDKGEVKVRRINEALSLINRVLYEEGQVLFETARPAQDGTKHIGAVVVGMGRYGTEMIKALAWFGQMDGYSLEIHGFDKDPLAEEKITALAPELMSEKYNGVQIAGEAQYTIRVHAGTDVASASFAKEIAGITNATYVLVALNDDTANIQTAVMLRMYFERMGLHPVIQAIVHNSRQKRALQDITNYRGQAYDITFLGDTEASYTREVMVCTELEAEALSRHLKWGKEEEFWAYEYNYRSSMASAIHRNARILCGIPGAAKKEEDLTAAEREIIEVLEHRRWNAYMRAEGYVFSGSKDPQSRNDLAKMHHDLVDFSSLSEEEKRKDGSVGTG